MILSTQEVLTCGAVYANFLELANFPGVDSRKLGGRASSYNGNVTVNGGFVTSSN